MISVIIGAAGKSERFKKDKMKAVLGGLPLLMRTLYPFQTIKEISEIILVVPPEKIDEMSILKKSFSKISQVIAGGKTRQQSIYNGVLKVKENFCLVHNGANPLVTIKEILQVITELKNNEAVFVGRKISSTLWKLNNNFITQNISRDDLYEAETPQAFKTNSYLKAWKQAKSQKNFTDEMSVLYSIGIQGKMITASFQNRKITYLEDLKIAENFLKPHLRVGLGHDAHQFTNKTKKPLILGATEIPFNKSFLANSDGDIILHALCNAIGTAIGEGSLSIYADEMCKNNITDSSEYLIHICKNMASLGYVIGNIALSLEGSEPRIEKFVKIIKKNMAKIMGINPFQIGLAVTSGENLSAFGKGQGMQCFAHVQLIKV